MRRETGSGENPRRRRDGPGPGREEETGGI